MADVLSIKQKLGGLTSLLRMKQAQETLTFSKTFRQGLVYGALFCTLLCGWMFLRQDDTAMAIQPLLPYKTAIIEVPQETKPSPQPTLQSEQGQEDLVSEKKLDSLPPAPLDGLFEVVEGKTLPIIRKADDMTPFQAYKKPYTPVAGRPVVAFVVTDFGLSDSASQYLLDALPADVTFVLNPYADGALKWANAARTYGHEFWLSLPMESKDSALRDNGPNMQALNASIQDNQNYLENTLSVASGYAGVVTQRNHVFVEEDAIASSILKEIFGRGLGLVESTTSGIPFGSKLSKQSGYPYVQTNLWLDDDLRPENVDGAFRDITTFAHKNGRVVVFFHPYPALVDRVKSWISSANNEGFQIAPLSAMVE